MGRKLEYGGNSGAEFWLHLQIKKKKPVKDLACGLACFHEELGMLGLHGCLVYPLMMKRSQ